MPARPARGAELPFDDDAFGAERELVAPAEEVPHLFGVRELTERIGERLSGLGRLSVEGEVAELRQPSSGHVYFKLKELDAVLPCKAWKSRVSALGVRLAEGMHVVCHGRLEVWPPHGSYSLTVDRAEQKGLGALLARLEALKLELRGRGWFERERPLPRWPRVVGVVTSRDSAAFQDFLRTRSLRWPGYPLRLAHTPVQGAEAARAIGEAIARLDASGVDLIVVIRGGGSLEDLWAFNELAVAEAIWNCSVPVVTGVGHQTDVTLADLVADRRAHTPTDAAQLVLPERALALERLERVGGHLIEALHSALDARAERLERAARSRCLRAPAWMVDDRAAALEQRARRLRGAGENALERGTLALERLRARLARHAPALALERQHARLERSGTRLQAAFARALEARAQRLERGAASLEATSPLAVLARGYSITRPAGGGPPLRSGAGLAAGALLVTRLAEGELVSRLERTGPAAGGPGES